MSQTIETIDRPINVIRSIEYATGVSYDKMKDKTRKREIVIARHLAMYFTRLTNNFISLNGIGDLFGDRDHSTVIHAIQTVEDHYDTDRDYRAKLNELCMAICPNEIYRLGTLTKEDLK